MHILPNQRRYRVFAIAIFFMVILVSCFCTTASAADKKFVVVIDAGHGGNDVGASEHGINEKDVNLAVALKLGNLIKKNLKNTEVVYTRDGDYFISLQKRADVANRAKADLFISIHCNSVDKANKNRSKVTGATTYILGRHRDADNLAVAQRENSVAELDANDKTHFAEFDPSKDESYIIFEMTQKKNLQNSARFASNVQKAMINAGRYSRGVQQAGFWVLWSTAMPAALIELDFICNPDQAKYLASKEGQDQLASSIFEAVKNYEDYFRTSLGMTDSSPTPSSRSYSEKEETPAERLAPADRSSTKASRRTSRRRPASARQEGSESVQKTVIQTDD